MSSLFTCRSAITLILLSLLSSQLHAQSCNTNQNPYCAGNSVFELLCCPYPAVCYYANRYGAVACCQAGSICQGTGVLITAAQTTQITQTVQITQTAQPTNVVQATQQIQTQNTGYSTVTVTGMVAATNTAIGYTTKGGVIIANDASWNLRSNHALRISLGLAMAILTWVMT
jgi:hypothetical protein